MRADRLLALLMLLQTRGKMTAAQLAAELEVSVRTIYRDMEALSMAGAPVYAETGPGGGCALLEGYRTTLTGLNADEVRALFMLNIPAPLDQLGVSHSLQAALRKLTAALPATHRADVVRTQERILLDPALPEDVTPVSKGGTSLLATLHRATWEDRCLDITYRLVFDTDVAHRVEPYGLVVKAGSWWLVGCHERQVRVYRVAQVVAAQVTDRHFIRPSDFDLVAYWRRWCETERVNRLAFDVRMRVSPALILHLPRHLGESIRGALAQAGPPDAEGWLTITVQFETFGAARERLLGFGGAAEVLEPEALRLSVADFAAQTVALYDEKG
jgi:predicted DNA-binding transcriptional regulator YafY